MTNLNAYLVMYDNGDFTQTRINATLEEAKQYYLGSAFTFGTCAENEYKAIATDVMLLDDSEIKEDGFYIVKPLTKNFTRIGLVWQNTVATKYGNETVSQVVKDVHKHPEFLANTMTRNELDIIANELKKRNGINEEIFVQYEI